MELYPIFLNLTDKKCLVVGGGKVAERKVNALARCGAKIHVVSPQLTPGLQDMVNRGLVMHRRGIYQTSDLEDTFLVISATNNDATNHAVANDCMKRNIVVNVVDDPPRCSFFVPSVVHRGSLKLAISTGGSSPRLAKLIRKRLERDFSPVFGEFTDFLNTVRKQVQEQVTDPNKREQILKNLVDETTFDLVKHGDLDKAKERVNNVCYINRCQS
ncbi:precorrin-2 dehydrogenase/sirohydrochlorin ferrochelatase family protein [Desulfallas thermosapovorans]|uniref:precorrin-2 dehydrogenase n=1 Tax=Desulfallas thermosapovorans DSM 6562 TaxID=1121431 RepID=A0A5S4ZQK7_9FIRM|nr:bifunctional precorrin-2 dehydrogenase/sirohydrochlorin ferrochelatase [Desulfallas thermosapovorans]TYO94989.1 precorrin-2 dehydrogenase [Desulfallas thermosapovorans DSM 6562]